MQIEEVVTKTLDICKKYGLTIKQAIKLSSRVTHKLSDIILTEDITENTMEQTNS